MISSWNPLDNLMRTIAARQDSGRLINDRHNPSKRGETTFPGATKGTSSLIDHGNTGGLTDDDHTQYLLIDGTRAMTGNLTMGAHYVGFSKLATPGAPASDYTLLYNDTTTERLHQVDDTGAAADLSKQNVVTLQGQALGLEATSQRWAQDQTQTLPCTVTSDGVYVYDFTNHLQTSGHGYWTWVARRDQSAAEFAQAMFAVGGQMDYNGCNTLKLRAKVKPYVVVSQGSEPGGGSYWEYIYAYVTENSGDNDTKSADLQSQTTNNAYTIIEADFDISGWSVGAEEGLFFGLEVKGVDVDDPDPDPVNEWTYSFSIEWIEVIAWIR